MNIAFYSPYPTISGVSILFLRLASYLSQTHNIFIMDLNGGYMHSKIPENCKFIPYDSPEMLPPDTILVVQSCALWRIPFIDKFDIKTRVFLWNLHPDNLNPNIGGKKTGLVGMVLKVINLLNHYRKKKLKTQTKLFIENKAIYFMDMENLKNTERLLDINIENNLLLPIINNVSYPNKIKNYKVSKSEVIKCIWVGRIEGFKLQILLYTISQLEAYKEHKIHLTIVGRGRDKKIVDSYLRKCQNLIYSCIDNVSFNELTNLFKDKHLAFGMGTSALDSASIGLPTVCLDYSYSKISKYYQFHFLHENTGYIVGSEINAPKFFSNSCNLYKIFNEIIHDGLTVSEKSFNYCLNNHSYRISDKIPDILSNSSLTIGTLLKYRLSDADFITKLIANVLNKNKVDSSGFILF
ncbi:hypothetical protein Sps_03725 [Shewanella psychrophila]|uniref:Glycosyltransferase n=1 Tax=Shewanella psychrophila TaxID=225848 RepID=A0A1S6HTI1_9GAMM|nr:glycosyltransferase family 4 protein [Shewanella psychrophila]AQS38843.1 hypothetical protein Sps_03725 [Shewanella psychrophila]